MSYVGTRTGAPEDRVEKIALLQMHYSTRAKSVSTTYVLWFFLGFWGIHRFYLGQSQLGIMTIGACIVLSILAMFTFGISLIPLGIWWIIELFTLVGTVRSINLAIEEDLRRQLGIRDGGIVIDSPNNSSSNGSPVAVIVVLLLGVVGGYFVISNRKLIFDSLPSEATTPATKSVPADGKKLWYQTQTERIAIISKKNPQMAECLSSQFQARFMVWMLAGCQCKIQIGDKKIRRHCTTRPIAKQSAKDCLLQSRIAMKSARKTCNDKLLKTY